METSQAVWVDYTNEHGQRVERKVYPEGIHFGMTEHSWEPGWILTAHPAGDSMELWILLANVHRWGPARD